MVERPVDTRWLSGPLVSVVVAVVVCVPPDPQELLGGGDVATGLVVTGVVVTGVVTMGAGTGIGCTGSDRGGVLTGVVVVPDEEPLRSNSIRTGPGRSCRSTPASWSG